MFYHIRFSHKVFFPWVGYLVLPFPPFDEAQVYSGLSNLRMKQDSFIWLKWKGIVSDLKEPTFLWKDFWIIFYQHFLFFRQASYEILKSTVGDDILEEVRNASTNGPSDQLFANCVRL